MNSSHELFYLIKSLDKQEKRYVKLFVGLNSRHGENKHLLLFDMVDKQKSYNEEKLKKDFGNTSFTKHLAVEKINLCKLILKSLRNYHAASSVEMKLKDHLKEIEILFKKGLYAYCMKLIIKAKKTAYRYELYEDLLQLMRWEKKVLSKGRYYEPEIVKQHLKERNDLVNLMKRLDQIHSVQDKLYSIYLKQGLLRSAGDLKQVITLADTLKKVGEGTSFNEKQQICKAYTHYYTILNTDLESRYIYTSRRLELFEANPHRIKEDVNAYISALNNHLITCDLLDWEEEFYKYLHRLRTAPQKFADNISAADVEAIAFELSYIQELYFYIKSGKFEKGLSLIEEVEAGIKKHKNYLHEYHLQPLYDNIACLYLYAKDYRNALKWQQKLFETAGTGTRDDVFCFAKILNLIIHYELGNNDLLESAIRSTHRFLRKQNKMHKLESIIISAMKKLPYLETEKQVTASFTELKEKLLPLVKDPFEKPAFEYFDFISWIESKIEHRDFKEVLRTKVKPAKEYMPLNSRSGKKALH